MHELASRQPIPRRQAALAVAGLVLRDWSCLPEMPADAELERGRERAARRHLQPSPGAQPRAGMRGAALARLFGREKQP